MERTWLEINLKNITENYLNYKKSLIPSQNIIPVVKANAYGHGDEEVCKALQCVGVNCFAVASAEEGIKLRKSGIVGDIIVLGYTPIDKIKQLYDLDISQTVYCEEYANEILQTNIPIKVHIAIDTGMNRLGFHDDNISKLSKTVRHYALKLNTVGVFTHLCAADTQHIPFSQGQISKFKAVLSRLSDLPLKYVHCMNSSAGMLFNEDVFNYVRLGIILYGLKPYPTIWLPFKLKPALTWKARVCMVKTINAGDYVGYSLTYQATKPTKVATVSVGYADGFAYALSNKGHVKIHGKKAKIIGRVCMDYFMVDVTDIENVCLQDEVVLLDDEYTADCMADDLDTIGYEVACNVSSRVPRIYFY